MSDEQPQANPVDVTFGDPVEPPKASTGFVPVDHLPTVIPQQSARMDAAATPTVTTAHPDPAQSDGVPGATITVNGYTFPASLDDLDVDTMEQLERQHGVMTLRGVMSADDYARFKATNPKVRDVKALLEAWVKAIGADDPGK